MQANGPMWQIDSNDHDIEPHTNGAAANGATKNGAAANGAAANGSATNGAAENGAVTTAANGTANTVPSIQDVIGAALKHVGPYKQLDNSKQVVALIDDVSGSLYFFKLI